MRRGAFLPAVLIVPLATMYGLDSSKSQPMHFLITFIIGLVCAAVVDSISRSAAERRIRELSKTTLNVGDGKLVWTSGMGETELGLDAISKVTVRQGRGSVRSITLTLDTGRNIELQGYKEMNDLLASLRAHVKSESFDIKKRFQV